MRRPSAHHRHTQFPFLKGIFFFILSVILLIGGGFYFLGDKGLPNGRYIVAVLGDPVEIVSFNPTANHWTTIEIPADTTMSGVQGLGEYRLNALWEVAATEASPSSIVLETLTHELGIPVTRYIGKKAAIWQPKQKLILLSQVVSFITGQYETNMSLGEYIGLIRKRWGISQENVTEFVVSEGTGLVSRIASDREAYLRFDQIQFDQYTDDAFEDTSVRQEGLRVAVYNTTGLPFVGSRTARILSKLGANVVFVGNEPQPVDTCELIGKSGPLASYTASLIRELFVCKEVVTAEDTQADLILKVGTHYAKKYFYSSSSSPVELVSGFSPSSTRP